MRILPKITLRLLWVRTKGNWKQGLLRRCATPYIDCHSAHLPPPAAAEPIPSPILETKAHTNRKNNNDIHTHTHAYVVYIYIYVYTHTFIYFYIYIYESLFFVTLQNFSFLLSQPLFLFHPRLLIYLSGKRLITKKKTIENNDIIIITAIRGVCNIFIHFRGSPTRPRLPELCIILYCAFRNTMCTTARPVRI